MAIKLVTLAVACGLLTAGCFAGTSPEATSPQAKGQGLADGWHSVTPREVDLPDGVPSSITDAGPGQLVLLNFWASFCGPCKTELPMLQRLDEQGRVRVLGISRDVKAAYAADALHKEGASYPDVVDSGATYMRKFAGLIPLNEIPSSVLVRDGRVVAVHLGPFESWKDLTAGL